jgi:hypothetical protein
MFIEVAAMTSKWLGVGSTLRGVAALVTACVGGVAAFYFAREPSTASDVPTQTSQMEWRSDALAVRRDMFDARRAAMSGRCSKTRPDAYTKAESAYRNAEEDFKAERYSVAIESFKTASTHYRECGKAG